MKTSQQFDGVILLMASLAGIVLSGLWAMSAPNPGERLIAAGIAASIALVLLLALFRRSKREPYIPLCEWYTVSFDENALKVHSVPPRGEEWSEQVPWSGIARAELIEEGLDASDRVLLLAGGGAGYPH